MGDGIDLSKYRLSKKDIEDRAAEAEEAKLIRELEESIRLSKNVIAAERKKADIHRGVPERKLGAQKDNTGKRLWKLLPTKAVGIVVDVLGYGAYLAPRPDGTKGYGENNWQGIPTLDYYDAALRHLTAWKLGERLDSASGLPHLAHAACCILFMLAQCEGVDT